MLRFRNFELDPALRELRREGKCIAIQKKVLDLLLYLIRFRGRVIPRAELLANVWPEAVVTDHALDQALYQARKVLGDDGGIVETIRGWGVRFAAEVTEVSEPPESKTAPFVGRVELVRAFECVLRAASEGAGGLILLGGEPGIGKTRVAEKFASLARERAGAAYLARPSGGEGASPLWHWVQLLRGHAAACGSSQRCELLANPNATSASSPGPARSHLFDGVAHFWRRASRRRPIVLILEDLHRADVLSWRLLQFITRELGGSRVVLVGTYRDTELPRDCGALLGELTRHPSARCFQLAGFSRDEVERFADLTMGTRSSPETVTFLDEHSNGNPFLLTQLVPLVETRRGGPWDSRAGGERGFELPRSAREAVLRHLAGLSPSCHELLTVAAVIGHEFHPRVLKSAAGHSRETVLEVLTAAAEARVVRESRDRVGHFQFRHLVIRDALRGSLAAIDRAHLHKKIGEVLERLYGRGSEEHSTELSYHFGEAAAIGEEERAIAYAVAAARLASEHLQFEEAASRYQRALEIAEVSSTHGERSIYELLLAVGRARFRAGMRGDARQAFRRAGEIARRLGLDGLSRATRSLF